MAIRHWRIPTKLNVILFFPVLVLLCFGSLRVQNSIETWREAEEAERVALLVEAASAYGHALANERDITAAPLLAGERDSTIVAAAYEVTDQAAVAFDEATERMPDAMGLQRRLAAFRKVEAGLADLRQAAYTKRSPGTQTEDGYHAAQRPLTAFCNELVLETGNITSYGRALCAITLAKTGASLSRSIGTHVLVEGDNVSAVKRDRQVTTFSSWAYLRQIAVTQYEGAALPEGIARLAAAEQDADRTSAKQLAQMKDQAERAGQTFVAPPAFDEQSALIASGVSVEELAAHGITAQSWFATSTPYFDAFRMVEQYLTQKAVADTAQIASRARTKAIVGSAILIVALSVGFIVAGVMARGMSRSIGRLRDAAFAIAEEHLPMLVQQLSHTAPGRVDTRVQPIPITTNNEIGEVARAFDKVHGAAVRVAAEQALLRSHISAILANLARRNQSLIESQLALITKLESNETYPDKLENLFCLDHLATRMRRNSENLLVLSGEELGRRWYQPIPLVDVLRAASAEVEQYERVELVGIPVMEIHGQAVTDLVHLLAELLENATTFSSPRTKVRVTATRLPDGRIMVEIHDQGIGLTAENFADINHKLANPPTVDASISHRMGLFVVGRLAAGHGIGVQLRPSGGRTGTVSLVTLPEHITCGGSGDELSKDESY
ncbi:sensor histidine kinase [Streptomyces ipomoeae]|uniref:sensor histidine kinase n=1 Tax=Streptomyces ipomoeae TaxID=103232 RepID=UPI001146E8E9|nr:nitrate- and nitrite sensing domain-containing protein [Streptomyces ipomoeae]TQE30402.1 sensor histidine kinase [Streptomyces ipomoeae]